MADTINDPRVKRRKMELDDIFYDFLKDADMKEALRYVIISLKQGFQSMRIALLKVHDANARTPVDFSRASCYTTFLTDRYGNERIFPMGQIFEKGLDVLEKYTADPPRIPEDVRHRQALAKLLNFLDDELLAFSDGLKDRTNEEWTLRVAQHLLYPLTEPSSCTINKSYMFTDSRTNMDICPCPEGDRRLGEMGDTSFGCIRGWQGHADIMMDDLPISVEIKEEISDNRSASSAFSAPEIKANQHSRLIAETIVWSFLERNPNKGPYMHHLVPGLRISSKSVMGYFYDNVNDVLIATPSMPLLGKSPKLNTYAVVFLWLTLNFNYFCSGVTDEMKICKANFFGVVGDFLDAYRKEVTWGTYIETEGPKGEENDWATRPMTVKERNRSHELEGLKYIGLPNRIERRSVYLFREFFHLNMILFCG